MADQQAPASLREKLLEQDAALHSPRYEEHRMQLEHQLTRAESRENLAKRVVVGALLVAAAVFLIIASRVFGDPDPYDTDATVLSVGAGVIYVVAWAVVFIGTASYYARFLPRVRHLRAELQAESLRELRREIHALRERLDSQLPASGGRAAPPPAP